MSHRYRFIGTKVAAAGAGAGDGGAWELASDEALHLAKVLRLEVGDEVEVTDGAGTWAVGRVAQVGAKRSVIEVEGDEVVEAPPVWPLVICVGALRPGVLDEILPGLVELGADEIHVFQQADNAKARLADKAVERWQRIVVAAIKQCKRARMPVVETHGGLAELLRGLGAGENKFVLDPAGAASLLRAMSAAPRQKTVLVIGGEKGLTESELTALHAAGFVGVSMGQSILRAVTAAVSACSIAAAVRAEA